MRYKNTSRVSLFRNASAPESFVRVGLNSSVLTSSASPDVKFNVMSLSDRGQEAFLHAINNKSTDAAQLMGLVQKNFEFVKASKANIRIIPKSIKKSLVFTVERLKYYRDANGSTVFNYPGDRIAYLELKISLAANSHVKFDSWDRYVTDHYTLNLGKVTSAQQWNASLSMNAKGTNEVSLSGTNSNEISESGTFSNSLTLVNTGNNAVTGPTSTTGSSSSLTSGQGYQLINSSTGSTSGMNSVKGTAELGGSASLAYSDKYETSLDLMSRIVKLSGSLAANEMLLQQESGQGIDLSGNVAVSIEYALLDEWAPPVHWIKFKELYNGATPKPLANVEVSYLTVLFPNITQDVTATLDFSFLYRQINKGNRHLPEARHKVTFWYGNVINSQNQELQRQPVTLIRKEEIRPRQYFINQGIYTLTYQARPLHFESVAEATTFLRYIGDALDAGVSVTGLTINGSQITAAHYPGFQIVTQQL